MLKLYFGHLMWTADSLEKSLMLIWERLRAEGQEDVRGWDGWTASPMQWTWTWANFGRWWGTERPGLLQSKGCKESNTTGWLSNSNNEEHVSKPSHLCLDVCLLSLFSGHINSSLQGLKTENQDQYQREGDCVLFQALQLYKLIRCCHFELSFPHPQNRNEIIILKKQGTLKKWIILSLIRLKQELVVREAVRTPTMM